MTRCRPHPEDHPASARPHPSPSPSPSPGPRIVVRDVSRVYHLGGGLRSRAFRLPWGRRRPDGEGWETGRSKVALDGVSLAVGPGEHVGVIGPNGAGKSTLLRIIAGLAAPTRGSVRVDGGVTAIFTLGLGLREECTGRQNIYLDGELRGTTRAEIDETIDEIIAFADIGAFIDQPLRTYSTGMKARLAFAMLIHVTPEILIIDEALSVGDHAFFAKAQRKLREICRRGKISLIVSHSMQNVVDLCTRCLWLEGGRLVMDGDPAVVTRAYCEAVRRQDEAAWASLADEGRDADARRTGCRIAGLAVFGADPSARPGTVRSGDRLSVDVDVAAVRALLSPRLRLRLEGLDGLLLAQSEHDAPELAGTGAIPRKAGYRVTLEPCLLNGGRYRIAVDLVQGQGSDVLARGAATLEVVAVEMPTGGRPVLRHPASVQARLVT